MTRSEPMDRLQEQGWKPRQLGGFMGLAGPL